MKKFLLMTLSLSMLVLLAPTQNISAETSYDVVSTEQMDYEMGEESQYAGQYVTYGVDDEGNYIRLSIDENIVETRGALTLKIAVKVGGILVGYLVSVVIDGIVKSATGQAGADWVSIAIREVLNRPYRESVTIDKYAVCAAYPPYGAGVKPYYCH